MEWLAAQLAETTALDAEYPQALEEARGSGTDLALTEIRSVIVSGEAPPPALGGIPALGADPTPTTAWIFLALHELAAVGPAEVVRVERCPPIEPGAGRLVTGTFSHHSGEVLDITVDGLTEPIGCTGAHPFWSEDRQDFIPARNLVLGETLRTESGTLRQITRITPRRGPPVPVFNLEVDAEHVYYVSVDGVLVHNAYHDAEFFDAPKTGTLSNVEARKWYLDQEDKILGEIDSNLTLRDRAVQAFNRRNELRTQARELMADRELAERLMREEPNLTLRDLVRRKYQQKGLVGDELWQDILDSSQKSRTSVNKKLGLE